MTLKQWFFGPEPPTKSDVKAVHDQLVTSVIEHKKSVDEFKKAAEELLRRMAVQERYQRRIDHHNGSPPK